MRKRIFLAAAVIAFFGLAVVASASHAPTNLTIVRYSTKTVTVGWTAVPGVTGYGLYVDGTRVATAGSSAVQAKFGTPQYRRYVLGVEALKTGGAMSTITVDPRWVTVSVFVPEEPPPPAVACGDGLDNDSDGKIDFPADPGCSSATDTDETDAPPPPAPTVSLTAQPTNPTTATSASFSWSSTNSTGFTCKLDAATASACTSPQSYTGLAIGSHTFVVTATGAGGSAQATATWTIETTPPPPSGVANLWVDTNGGTCVRQATAAAYVDAQACSWDQANDKCAGGDTAAVKGGSYGDVTLSGSNGRTSACTFQTAAGESVVMDYFNDGRFSGGDTGADWITVIGPVRAVEFTADFTNRVTVDGWTVDCNGCINVQMFHVESATNFTARNSDISDNYDNSLIWINGSNITFDHNVIHNAGLRPGSGAHTECIYAWAVTNLTLTRNSFHHCAVMDVFITGSSVASGGYVENNIFEPPCEDAACTPQGLAFHFRNGGDPSPNPSNWVFRNNTFIGPLSISSENLPVGPVRIVNNDFQSGAPCSLPNTTYSRNKGCPGGPTTLVDQGDPTDFPSLDIDGLSRPRGAGPDVGAKEIG